jgi:hypothetical protein
MPRRFHQDHQRETDQVAWSDLPKVFWMAFGIALLLGFLIGVGWIGWNLVAKHVLR